MVFTADHRVKAGFPPSEPNAPAVRDEDFTYLQSGTWRLEGDVLVQETDNHLLVEMYPREWNDPKPKLEREVRRDRIVSIDDEQMVFEDGSRLKRVKR